MSPPLRCLILLQKHQHPWLCEPNVYPSSSGRITYREQNAYVLPAQGIRPPAIASSRPERTPRCAALCRIASAEGLRRFVAEKSLSSWCFPGREVSFIRSVQRTATSRPQPIRIRGKVREADSLPDTRGRIVSSKNKRYDYPSYIYFDRGAHIQLPHYLFD